MLKAKEKRKKPWYRTEALVMHYSYKYEYPKEYENFIWGIPFKYGKRLDREISAITASFIYDGNKVSIRAAKKVDALFNGNPSRFIAKKEFNLMILEKKQTERIYKGMTLKDVYHFFQKLYDVYYTYGSIYSGFRTTNLPDYRSRLIHILEDIPDFTDDTLLAHSKLNMFLFMVAHCFDDFDIDSSKLLVPIYERNTFVYKMLGFLEAGGKLNIGSIQNITDRFKWFSEENPMTYCVSVWGIQEAIQVKDRMLTKLDKRPIIKHRFKKK